MPAKISRRAALTVGALASLGLAACSSDADDSPASSTDTAGLAGDTPSKGAPAPPTDGSATATGSSASGGPAYVPYTTVEPDMPATDDGVSAAFLKYPTDIKQMHTGVPGQGGEVTSFTQFSQALAIPLDNNPYWQQFNQMLGVKWKATIADSDFSAKFATMVAGGDLPDLTMVSLPGVPNLLEVLQHEFVDLSEYLGGDAIKDYPSLAGFAPACWSASTVNGFLAGVPLPREQVKWVMIVREDYREANGLTGDVETKEDFVALCKGLTDVRRNRYAMGYPAAAWGFIQEVFRVPNEWVESDGKFTNAYETDEMKGAIDWFHTLVQEDCFNPDAFAASGSTINGWLYNGTVGLRMGPPGVWTGALPQMTDKNAKFALVKPPGTDGQPGRQILGPGTTQTVTGINKKLSPARIRELLNILDWMASPFGTTEYQFFTFGIEGRDFNFVDGAPTPTDTASHEMNVAPKIADPMQVIYVPGQPDIATAIYDYEKDTVPDGARNPAWGLYSPTQSSKGSSLGSAMMDMVYNIAQGRKKLSDWDSTVKSWQSNGGDQIRKEYEEAFAAQ